MCFFSQKKYQAENKIEYVIEKEERENWLARKEYRHGNETIESIKIYIEEINKLLGR